MPLLPILKLLHNRQMIEECVVFLTPAVGTYTYPLSKV